MNNWRKFITENNPRANIRRTINTLLFIEMRLHDIAFRKTHKCNCKRRVNYGNADWYYKD